MLALQANLVPIAFTCLIIAIFAILDRRSRRRRFPGPSPLPFIGNVHQFPKGDQFRAWTKWGAKYGPIVELRAFSQRMLVVNSHQVAVDILAERGQAFSGRSPFPMAGGEVGWNEAVTMMDPGEKFNKARKILNVIQGSALEEKFSGHVESEVYNFVTRLYADPGNFAEHLKVTTAALVFLIGNGYTVDPRPNSDPFLRLAHQVIAEASMSMEPGVWWIDMLPILKYVPWWFPGATFKRLGRLYRDNLDKMVRGPYEWTKTAMSEGKALESVTSALINEAGDNISPEDEKLIQYGTFVIFTGGADTTLSAATTLFLAISRSPQVVARAQEELDEVVGQDRLPVWKDRKSLPYVDAIVTEMLRIIPPVPLGIPHKATDDDVYQGRPIEKGTVIFTNIWGMSHDEAVFPRPWEFSPERYLLPRKGGAGKSKWAYVGYQPDPRAMAFGYGRRVCPGRELALMELWHLAVLVLHLFDVKPLERNPTTMKEHKVVTEMISHPDKFDCKIKPRSDKTELLIRNLELGIK